MLNNAFLQKYKAKVLLEASFYSICDTRNCLSQAENYNLVGTQQKSYRPV